MLSILCNVNQLIENLTCTSTQSCGAEDFRPCFMLGCDFHSIFVSKILASTGKLH